jgi:uncharacterized protein involved in copper resistance
MTRTLSTVLVLVSALAIGATRAGAQHIEHQQPPAEATRPQKPASGDATDHSQHQQPPRELPAFIPPLTDDDRKAAFPQDVEAHAVHDRSINSYVLFDQLEWQSNAGPRQESHSWRSRLRSESSPRRPTSPRPSAGSARS